MIPQAGQCSGCHDIQIAGTDGELPNRRVVEIGVFSRGGIESRMASEDRGFPLSLLDRGRLSHLFEEDASGLGGALPSTRSEREDPCLVVDTEHNRVANGDRGHEGLEPRSCIGCICRHRSEPISLDGIAPSFDF